MYWGGKEKGEMLVMFAVMLGETTLFRKQRGGNMASFMVVKEGGTVGLEKTGKKMRKRTNARCKLSG